jgi:hypothetical protein
MKEDGQLNYIGNAPENMNIMRKTATGMLVQEKTVKESKNIKMVKALLSDTYRELILKV